MALAMAFLGSPAHGELCAGWNFNEFISGDQTQYSTTGDGVLTIDDRDSPWGPLQGTALNGWGDWSPGNALGIRGVVANGSTLTIQHPVQSFLSAECRINSIASIFLSPDTSDTGGTPSLKPASICISSSLDFRERIGRHKLCDQAINPIYRDRATSIWVRIKKAHFGKKGLHPSLFNDLMSITPDKLFQILRYLLLLLFRYDKEYP